MRKKGLIYIFAFLLLISQAYAATLHGSVYDLSLDKVSGVVIELNTTPLQRVISRDGSYSFSINPGSYKITARQLAQNLTLANAEEKIQIIEDGNYTLDLFLYPSFEEEEALMNSSNLSLETPPVQSITLSVTSIIAIIALFLIILALALAPLYIRLLKKPTPAAPSAPLAPATTAGTDLETVLKILSSEGGRATQKEIRKQLPLSEAKVSLIIAELEAKGIIEKIKKGRGNIIVLKKQ